ncbi:hypothetical protein L5D93_26385 [Paenibacillus thiaminolyticus]|nr:hypothetical protein [Paenibacillus thiaminolyticus]
MLDEPLQIITGIAQLNIRGTLLRGKHFRSDIERIEPTGNFILGSSLLLISYPAQYNRPVPVVTSLASEAVPSATGSIRAQHPIA